MNTIVFVGAHSNTFDVKWHTHENWELVLCTSGQGVFRFRDGRVIPYQEGDLVAIPPQEVHANSSKVGFSNIHLNIEDASIPYSTAFKIQDENGSLYQTFLEARTYYNSDRIRRELVLASLGDLIISYLILFRSNAALSEPVEQIRNSILKNYTNPLFALDEYVRSLPFHYDYLRKLFKKEMGMSPLEYMTGLRMKNAERLLSSFAENSKVIYEIALKCGYDNALYFSRVFKKYYGCSPSQFIKKNREIYYVDPGRQEHP